MALDFYIGFAVGIGCVLITYVIFKLVKKVNLYVITASTCTDKTGMEHTIANID